MASPRGGASTRLILIRHGHTASNTGPDPRLSGRTDVSLSERGLEQVARLRATLRGSSPFDAIYSSPLRRARETAEALAAEGLGPLRVCAELQEIDCGSLDGLPLGQVEHAYPELWAANLRQSDDAFRWPGGESYRELRCRCLRAVRVIARAHAGGRVAVVTHAGVIGQLLGYLHGAGAAAWGPYRPGYTGVTEVEWWRGSGTILRYDNRDHLEPAPP